MLQELGRWDLLHYRFMRQVSPEEIGGAANIYELRCNVVNTELVGNCRGLILPVGQPWCATCLSGITNFTRLLNGDDVIVNGDDVIVSDVIEEHRHLRGKPANLLALELAYECRATIN